MKNFRLQTIGLLLMASINAFSQLNYSANKSANITNEDSTMVKVTYIGAAGFLLEAGDKKVLIDGLFDASGANGFMMPSTEVFNAISSNLPPFDSIDLYLIGHGHTDHMTPANADAVMQNDSTATLVCATDALQDLTDYTSNYYTDYEDRVFAPSLGDNEKLDTIINGFELEITRLPPFSYHSSGVLLFSIKMNGIKICHLTGNPVDASLYDADIDVLLAADSYISSSTYALENRIDYKVAYIHHIYNYAGKLAGYNTKCQTLRNDGHKVYVLQSAMEERLIIKTNDTLVVDPPDTSAVNQDNDTLVVDPTETSAVNQINKNIYIEVYPNPTSGDLNIKFEPFSTKKCYVELLDLAGKKIVSNNYYNMDDINLDISCYPSGLYYLKLVVNEDELVNKNILLQ